MSRALPLDRDAKRLFVARQERPWALLLAVLLVAVPGLSSVKLLALVAVFVVGTFRGDFGNRGWLVGASAIVSLCLAYFVGMLNDVPAEDRLNQAVRIASFYAVFACIFYFRFSLTTRRSIDSVCLSIAVLMALIKVGMWVSVVFFGFSLETVMEFFGFETVTLLIGFNIFRLQFPSDFVCLFLIACYFGRRSKLQDFIFIFAVGIVIFLSFSRFIFLCFFVGLAVRGLWLKRIDAIALFGIIILTIVFAVFSNELVERFVGEGSEVSDETRVEQIQALSDDIDLHPVFGRGVGGAVPYFSRSESLPFSYESQWYATVMQLGWFGTLILLANVAAIVFWRVHGTRSVICISILFLLWFLAGFTNPFITSLGSAVGLAIARQRATLA